MKRTYKFGFRDTVVRINPRDVAPGGKFVWRDNFYEMDRECPGGVLANIEGTAISVFVGHNAKVECYFSDLNWH